MNQIVIFAVLASLAIAHGASLSPEQNNVQELVAHKEGRILEVPTIGAIVWKATKIGWFLAKSAWSVIGLKVAAIALAANVAIWLLKHGVSVIIGAVVAFGFCKITGKCNLDYVPKDVYSVGDTLYYVARQLQNGADLYDGSLSY